MGAEQQRASSAATLAAVLAVRLSSITSQTFV